MPGSLLVSDQPVTGIVLAGGRGSRMGHVDKGLVELDGKRLVEHVIDRIRDHVDELIISCNRNLEIYQQYGTVVPDRNPGFPGPLMGILSAAEEVSSPLCLVVPCDMPRLPDDLCPRLLSTLGTHELCLVHDGQRLQPLVALLKSEVTDSIEEYLLAGNSSVMGWIERLDAVTLDFSDKSHAFDNINTPRDH